MKSIVFIILCPIIIFCQSKTGTINGQIIDADYNYNMTGANVILLGAHLGAVTDSNGYYEFKNVPLGKYILQCSFIGYITQEHTIELTRNNLGIVKDFYLGVLKIPISMPDSLKEYHNFFSSYKPKEILNIFIDSISRDYETLYLTFRNKTKYAIYLIEDLSCFNTVKVNAKNESGENIRQNIFRDCNILPIILPDNDNLIKLEALSSISFPALTITGFDLKDYSLPKGKYYISIKYEIKDITYLPLVYGNDFDYYESFKYQIEVMNQATRGIYFSENELVIDK